MSELIHTALRYVLVPALLLIAHQFSYAGLIGDNLTYERYIYYLPADMQGSDTPLADYILLEFTAGSETSLIEDITLYDNRIDFHPFASTLPIGSKIIGVIYNLYNFTEAWLSVQINAQRTNVANANVEFSPDSDYSYYFNLDLLGVPIDGTATISLDILTVNDATAVPEPHITALILIGVLMWLLTMSGSRWSWQAIWISIKQPFQLLRLLEKAWGNRDALNPAR
ncbi:MAG TPA: hypothetical protein VF797_20920 [Noviherbaspirillum sp.]